MITVLGRKADLPAQFRILVLAILLAILGCSTQSADQFEDSARAKYILVTALDAWRAGKTKSLTTRNPPIRFADDDQIAGTELVDYEFEDESAPIQPFQNVTVILSLKDKQGQTTQKNARYQIGVDPVLTVLRSDN